MENKILQGYLTDFKKDYNFNNKLSEEILFEHFCNYCILSKIHPEAFYNDNFKIESINVGGGNDTGIDGIAIVVNEHIVESIEEVEDLKKLYQRLDVRFIFTQAKTSAEFKSSEIGNFIFGVKDFFKEKPSLVVNEDILNLRNVRDYIYQNSINMEEKPTCELHYITTGRWLEDPNVRGRINSEISELREMDIFINVNLNPVDAELIQRYYKEVKNKVTKEINFEKNTPLPRIEGVKEAYIGILPSKEYFKLITDSDGVMQKTLFYDNVRDFLGLNPVNKEIQDTLLNPDKQLKFPILNNGITIVAKSLNKVGTYFKVKDFQVVNGCQTSNMLYNNRESLDLDNTYIPVKLIITDNQDVINDIIKATNRQTEVKIEAFESLKGFHKKLQAFFDSYPPETKLYYERRPREYDTIFPPISRSRIISLSAQINATMSMFLNEPHSTHRYYGELLKANSGKIFKDEDNPYVYYISSLTLIKVDGLIKSGVINSRFKKYKYHLITVLRIIIAGFRYPNFGSKDITKYCDLIMSELSNSVEFKKAVKIAESCIDKALSLYIQKHGERNINDYKRLRDFTFEVIEQAKLNTKIKQK